MKYKNVIDMIRKVNQDVWKDYPEGKDTPVTEIQMHKILFILYGFFWKKEGRDLFEPNFEAWKYGPVEINYRNFIINNDEQLLSDKTFQFSLTLNEEQEKFLEEIIAKCLRKNIWALVSFTHETSAWDSSYDEKKQHCKIKKELIRSSFENIDYWN